MSKILIILSLFLTSVCFRFAFSQSIEIKKLSETINSEESEFNFFQTDEKTAYYTKSTLGENGYQSLIYKTNLKNGNWQKGRYFHVGEHYSAGNIYFLNKTNKYCFTGCNEKQECIIFVGEIGSEPKRALKHKDNRTIKESDLIRETHPIIVQHQDKRVLYFSSNRRGGHGGMDIWLSIIDQEGNFGVPINLGKKVNTTGDEITPHYNIYNNSLYFSSDRNKKEKGFDIYIAKGELNLWKEAKEAKEFNTEQDEMYITFFSSKKGYFSSNRGDTSCCNNIYSFQYEEKKIDTTYINILNDTINLYFHNDEPKFSKKSDTTEITYKESYISYFQKKEEYMFLNNNKDVEAFFSERLKYNFNKTNLLLEQVLLQLGRGRTVEIKINGYSSPLHTNEYNISLSKRRIISFLNFLYEYNSNSLKEYLTSQQLKITINSYGEQGSEHNISDDPNNKIKSIYSVNAMLQRRIEIIGVSSQQVKKQ